MPAGHPFVDTPPRVLVVESDRRWLADRVHRAIERQAIVERAGSLSDADRVLSRDEFDLFVVTRDRPVADPAPLASIAGRLDGVDRAQVLGVWCEGEGRTGRVVEGYQRVFWHAWPMWWRRWCYDSPRVTAPVDPLPGATVGIVADGDAASAIRALLEAGGAECFSIAAAHRLGDGDLNAVVWDGSQLGGVEAERLRATCGELRRRSVPVVAMLDFPRPETVSAAEAIGVDAVLGKPCDGELLCEAIRGAIGQTRGEAAGSAARPIFSFDRSGSTRAA